MPRHGLQAETRLILYDTSASQGHFRALKFPTARVPMVAPYQEPPRAMKQPRGVSTESPRNYFLAGFIAASMASDPTGWLEKILTEPV